MLYSLEDFRYDVSKSQPIIDTVGTDPWMLHVRNFRDVVLETDMDDFLRNPIIRGTMFVGNNPAIDVEYKYLLENNNWYDKWQYAIKEPKGNIGNPVRYLYNQETSGNYIHCAYHLAQFEERMNFDLTSAEVIVEIGCGYGAMCNVAYQAGFRGRYYLFDLPIFNCLQKYYLSQVGNKKAEFISDIEELEELSFNFRYNPTVISTWAISEMPADYRARLLKFCALFKHLLFAYQLSFEKMDIKLVFEQFKEANTIFGWQDYLINHMSDNHKYLFGSNFYEQK